MIFELFKPMIMCSLTNNLPFSLIPIWDIFPNLRQIKKAGSETKGRDPIPLQVFDIDGHILRGRIIPAKIGIEPETEAGVGMQIVHQDRDTVDGNFVLVSLDFDQPVAALPGLDRSNILVGEFRICGFLIIDIPVYFYLAIAGEIGLPGQPDRIAVVVDSV